MTAKTAYECDGPGCDALTHKEAGARFPTQWPRVSVSVNGGKSRSGSFHSADCVQAFLADVIPIGAYGTTE